MTQLAIGSRIRKSPFYDSTISAGVSAFTIYNKMYLPVSYGDPEGEYRRLTESVALWDVACERQVEIEGPDAAELAQYLSARDLSNLSVGRALYAPICDHDGRLINDPVILRTAEQTYWLSIADSDILLWARAVAGERSSRVRVTEPDVSPLAVQGPMAADLCRDLFEPDLVDSLRMFEHRWVDLDGIPVVLCRSGWSKQGGFELFLCDGSQGAKLWKLVMAKGERYGIGPGAPNHTERIESGLLSFGSDTNSSTSPFEAGLGAFCSLDVDYDFIGKQALRDRSTSPNKQNLVNVTLDGTPIPCEHPWPASSGGVRIGELRNAAWSWRLGSWIGLALLNSGLSGAGTTIEVHSPQGVVTARITDEPFGTIRTH